MPYLSKCSFRFYQLYKGFSRNSSSVLKFPLCYSGFYQCKKHISSSKSLREDEIPSALSKYEKFSEETAPIILDVDEEREKASIEETVIDEFEGVNLERGVTGVFDVSELVDLLKKEKAEDIFVAKIPPEHNYVDYMVVTNCKSKRHMFAVINFIRRVYKKKVNSSNVIPKLEGKDCSTWMCMDLGNIVLHVFSKAGREFYDLETLWSVGKEYDSHTEQKVPLTSDMLLDFSNILASLSPKT